MQHPIIFDTNNLLNLYYLDKELLLQLQKLISLRYLKPVTTKLIVEEFERNRHRFLKDIIKKEENKKAYIANINSFNRHIFSQLDEYDELKKKQRDYQKSLDKLIDKYFKIVDNRKLFGDEMVKIFIKNANIYTYNKSIINKAKDKYDLGFPPGKGSKYNDMVNWISLIEGVKKEHKPTKGKNRFFKMNKLYFCVNDNDYLDNKEYLSTQFKTETKIDIEFINLKDFANKLIPDKYSELKKSLARLQDMYNSFSPITESIVAQQKLIIDSLNFSGVNNVLNIISSLPSINDILPNIDSIPSIDIGSGISISDD